VGNGKGKLLSFLLLAGLNIFIRTIQDKHWLPTIALSISMTYDKYLQLVREDTNGNTIELEFTNDGIEYYFESFGMEGVTSYEQRTSQVGIRVRRGICPSHL
jgi:hypothetical protein